MKRLFKLYKRLIDSVVSSREDLVILIRVDRRYGPHDGILMTGGTPNTSHRTPHSEHPTQNTALRTLHSEQPTQNTALRTLRSKTKRRSINPLEIPLPET